MGTEELSHNCGGSFAYTETRMSSAQLQSIKNAVNTDKVSLTIRTPNRNAEAGPRSQWTALYNSLLCEMAQVRHRLKCHPSPKGLLDNACKVHH